MQDPIGFPRGKSQTDGPTGTWGDALGKVIAFLILAAIFFIVVVPVLIGIGRWTWGWALDDETIPDKPAQVDE